MLYLIPIPIGYVIFHYRLDRWIIGSEYIINSLAKQAKEKRSSTLGKYHSIKNYLSSIMLKARFFLVGIDLRSILFGISGILLVLLIIPLFTALYITTSTSVGLITSASDFPVDLLITAGSLGAIIYVFMINYVDRNVDTISTEVYIAWNIIGLRLVIVGSAFLTGVVLLSTAITSQYGIEPTEGTGDIVLLPIIAVVSIGVILSITSMLRLPLYGGLIDIQENLAKKAIRKRKNAQAARAIAKNVLDTSSNDRFNEYSGEINATHNTISARDTDINSLSYVRDIRLSDSQSDVDELILHVLPGDQIEHVDQPILSYSGGEESEVKQLLKSSILTSWSSNNGFKPSDVSDSDIISDFLSIIEERSKNSIDKHHSRILSYCVSKYVSFIREYSIHTNSQFPRLDRKIEPIESLLRVYTTLEKSKKDDDVSNEWCMKHQKEIIDGLITIIDDINDESDDVRIECISAVQKIIELSSTECRIYGINKLLDRIGQT